MFVVIDDNQCWNWPKRTGGPDVEMFEILHRDWNLKPIFTQKWASVDMDWGGWTPIPWQFQHWWWLNRRVCKYLLTLWRPVVPHGYSYKASYARPG